MMYGQGTDESIITNYLDAHLEGGIKQKNLDLILDLMDEYVEILEAAEKEQGGMIKINGYSIEEYPKQNKVVITLPQTEKTMTNTYGVVADRKEKLSQIELSIILQVAKGIYEGRYGDE